MPGPPDKFVFLNLTGVNSGTDTVNALGTAYQNFFNQFGVWPNQIVAIGNYVYLGAY